MADMRSSPVVDLSSIRTSNEFGNALASVRLHAGLSVRDLVREVDIRLATLGGYFSGRHLPRDANVLRKILRACGVTDDDQLSSWVECMNRVRMPLGRPSRGGIAPYRGLEPFRNVHSEWFFGRSSLTDRLCRAVTAADTCGIVLVIGPSGSGKSSIVHAGLTHRLTGEHSGAHPPAAATWTVVTCTPGPDPLSSLCEQLSLVDAEETITEDDLRDDPAAAMRRLLPEVGGPLVVVVDQLEEIFTACANPDERSAFVHALHKIATLASSGEEPAFPVRVVASLRSDFYDRALQLPRLETALQNNQVIVGALSSEELREVIIGPAEKAKVRIDEGLVHLIMRDLAPTGEKNTGAAHDVGALPLLSYALLSTWSCGNTKAMTVLDYTRTGGINGAIKQAAERVFTRLSLSEQELTRQLFVRLVHVGDNSPDTRRRVRLDELTGDPDESFYENKRAVLGQFVDARLITVDLETVEISHEALLRAWPRLREWIDQDREGHRLRGALTEDAQRWVDNAEEPGGLLRGQRLTTAVAWSRNAHALSLLTPLERRFLERSVAAADAERVRNRRRTRVLLSLVVVLAVVSLVAASMAYFFVQERDAANREREIAVSRQVAGTADRLRASDPALAAQLTIAAYRIHPTVEAQSALVASTTMPLATRLARPSGARQAITVSPDGTVLAAAGATMDDHDVLLWDLSTPTVPRLVPEVLTGHSGSIYGASFSPNGRLLATGSDDRTVRLWDVGDLDHPRALGEALHGPEDRVLSVEFSPDGRLLAAGSRDGSVWLWDVSNAQRPTLLAEPMREAEGAAQAVAFGPDGLLAVADAAQAAHLWRLETADGAPTHVARIPVPSRVNAIAFAPDAPVLATGSNDGLLRMWSVSNPSRPVMVAEPLEVSENWINAMSFAEEGQTVAIASSSNNVHVWDLRRRQELLVLPHPEPTTAVAFRGGDQRLITNSADGVARLWSFPGPAMRTADREISSLAFSPDGGLLADAGVDVSLWEVADGRRVRQIGPPLPMPPGVELMSGLVSINADGSLLAASARGTNDVWLWDISNPAAPELVPTPLHGHSELVEEVRFAPNAPLLVTAGDDDTIRLWNVADPHAPRALAQLAPGAGNVFMVAFSPDGRTVTAATQAGRVLRWDVSNPSAPQPLDDTVVSTDYVYSVDISKDATTMATGTADGKVQLWDLTDGAPEPIGRPMSGPDGYVHALRFSPDGGQLAAGMTTGQLWVWDLSDREHPRLAVLLQEPNQSTWAIAYRPRDSALAAVLGDTVLLDPDPVRIVDALCAASGTPISREEWSEHVLGAGFREIC